MRHKFSASVNILRDAKQEISYIATPNSSRLVSQIARDFQIGIRSFNIIGSYGTGKSAFLWAFQQSLLGRKKYFDDAFFYGKNCEFINIVGEFGSLIDATAEALRVGSSKNKVDGILTRLFDRYHDLGKKNPLLVIQIDEFGKFLEYAAQNNPEKELYFIQQLSEFVNNPELNILFITTVHQNIDAYGFGLNPVQRQEWTKVKGRFRELVFNEPIEQLLFLASQYFSNTKLADIDKKQIGLAKNISSKTKAFDFQVSKIDSIAQSLYPLELLSANALALSLQRYGQNERSLFSFLESTDETGLQGYDKTTNPFFNISCVYDYITYNFYSFISSRYNPDYLSWSGIKNSIEEVERTFSSNVVDALKIVKSIGMLSLTVPSGSVLDRHFLENYSSICLGIKKPELIIKELEAKKIILYRNYNTRYVLFEGTDLDIQLALTSASNKIGSISNVSNVLNQHYNLPPVIAKAESYKTGTPRLFEYKITDLLLTEKPRGEIDGFINLIFNGSISVDDVIETSKSHGEAIIYGLYQNSEAIIEILTEIEKTKKVKEENIDDRVAVRELDNVLIHQQNLLNHKILNNFYSSTGELVWIYNGKILQLPSKKEFNKQLSQIAAKIYSYTPHFRNELVNKHKISGSIYNARRNYFKALLKNWNVPDLGFPKEKYPPEKTIYLSLLKNNGIPTDNDVSSIKKNSTFKHLWEASEGFLQSAKHSRKNLLDFTSLLLDKPFKMKQGFIDFWIPTFLFLKREDFALFSQNGFIPSLNEDVLELVAKNPEQYEIKMFDVAGIKLEVFNSYRAFLNQSTKDKVGNKTFIETIRPFLTFYKQQTSYVKTTKRLSKTAIAVRTAIANSKDPEQTFFEDLPTALGYTINDLIHSKEKLSHYIPAIEDAIRELRACYGNLVDRIENFIISDFIGEKVNFETCKLRLQGRYKHLKRHLLLETQKTFIARLDSLIDDRTAWLSSLAQTLIGKPLDSFTDIDEPIFCDKFKSMILDLDSLVGLSVEEIDEFNEEAMAVEIGTFVEGVNKLIVRLPKNKKKEFLSIENSIRDRLTKDRTLNISVLANILRDLIRK